MFTGKQALKRNQPRSPHPRFLLGSFHTEEMASYSSWFPQAGMSSFCDRQFSVLLSQDTDSLPVCLLAPSWVQLCLAVCLQRQAPPSVLQHGQTSGNAPRRLLPHQAGGAHSVTPLHELSPISLFAPSRANPAAEVLHRSGANTPAASVVRSWRSDSPGIAGLQQSASSWFKVTVVT